MPFSYITDWDPATDPDTGPGIIAITKANPGVLTVSGTLNFVVGNTVFLSGIGGMVELNNRALQVTSITPSGGNNLVVVKTGGVNVDTSGYTTYTGGGTITVAADGGISSTGVATCYNNLFDDGAHNTIAWGAATNAQRYNVYKLSNGLYGYIGQTRDLSFTDDNIAADISKTPPLQENPFNQAGRYPAAVGYFEQRRCFAGVGDDPAYFWATRSGTESSLAYSLPSRDDDSIRFRIAARERCAIRHIVPMSNLVLLSESSEWRVTPASGEVLTPDVSVRAQSAIGAGQAQPVLVNNNLIFAAARGGHLRELAYNFQANGYLTGDVSLRAPHLFDGFTVGEIAYAKSPVPIVWSVSSSGNLLGLTYVPEQEIGAFHQHDTLGGTFESICVVPEGESDVLYAVVLRNGERFIERMEPRRSEDDAGGFFVDAGLTYDGAPATVFSGLEHLEGQSVSVLADGAVMASAVVTSGAVTISQPASLVHVGLPITADLKTLPMAIEIMGYGQGRPKNVNDAWLRVFSSRGVFVGPGFDQLTEYKPRSIEPYGSAPNLVTGEIKVTLSPTWATDGEVCVRHTDPLPFTLVAMTLGFAIGG